MKQFLKNIPGFRSDSKWKKILAANVYIIFFLLCLINGLDFFLLSITALVFAAAVTHLAINIITKRNSRTPLVLFLATVILLSSGLAVGSLKDIKDKERAKIEQDKTSKDIKN